MSEAVVVFARQPVPGRVKTRLGRGIGHDQACNVYRHLLAYTLAVLASSGRRTMLWLTPESDSSFLSDPIYRGHLEIYRQSGESLGDRMHLMFRSLSVSGLDRIVLVGSDCPGLTPAHVDAAFDSLDSRDLVLGPTVDGGYWLIGMKPPVSDVFSGITYSRPDVLERTVARAADLGCSTAFLETLSDIDEPDELQAFSRSYAGEDPNLMEVQLVLASGAAD